MLDLVIVVARRRAPIYVPTGKFVPKHLLWLREIESQHKWQECSSTDSNYLPNSERTESEKDNT
eukprot:6292326-Amphidinium_carterae.1